MAALATIKNAIFSLFQGAPGKSMNVDLQTIGDNADDAELYFLPGFFSRPHDGETGVVIDVQGLNIVIATNNYKLDISIDKGEGLIFSYDVDGNILSSAKCDKNGNFVVNAGARKAVSFDELKAGFDQLKSDFNSFLTHVHPAGTPPGSTGPVTPPVTPSTASVDTSEVPEVKLP